MRAYSVTRTTDLEDEIIERLSKGEPLEHICREPDKPTPRAVQYWASGDPEFGERFGWARDDGFDAIAYDIFELSSKPYDKLEDGRIDPAAVSARKLEIDTKLKLLAKWDPRRYGDYIRQEHSGSIAFTEALEAARQRVLESGRRAREE